MLVLTRKAGESIVIGNEIVVTVLEVRSDQVRIGIAAPRSVQVHREEVFQQMARENAAAVTSADRSNPLLQTRKPAGSRSGRPVPPRRQAPPSNSTGPTGSGAPPNPPAS